jgi:hypothetical protein
MILSDDRTDDRSLLTESLAIEFLPILLAESTGYLLEEEPLLKLVTITS